MDSQLETRFISFLESLDGAENLDRLLSEQTQRADFLLNQRQIVVEIKSLETDPEHKVQDRLKAHQNRPEYPVFFWPAELSEVLNHLPDGEKVKEEIFHALTRSIQGAFEKAEDQISSTRSKLNLREACGVLVVLNESLGILNPEMIAAKISQMLRKRRGNAFRYTEISYVLIISESHGTPLSNGTLGLPMILVEGPSAEANLAAGEVLDNLMHQWARFQKIPLLHLGEIKTLEGITFDRRDKEPKQEKQPLRNQDIWREQYRGNPYLSGLSKEDFLQHAAKIVAAMTPHFLKGGKKLPEEAIRMLMVGWTHALEEAERRRLDMKELGPYVDRAFGDAGIDR